jgi:hypothetical protein
MTPELIYSYNLQMMIPSIFSISGSLLVAFTYIFFKDLRNLRYVELVYYIALNDIIASIASFLGVLNDSDPLGRIACYYQGMSTSINFLSSCFWTVVISYQMWLIVHKGLILKEMKYIHLICWGLPILVGVLPIFYLDYGNQTDG